MVLTDIEIKIDQNDCIKCLKCVRVCPSAIFDQNRSDKVVITHSIETCIGCGHCVDICPTMAVKHSCFSENDINNIDYSMLPTPEQVLLLIQSRRSNRVISSKNIPSEYLDQIIEAAYYAPTAQNAREISFKVITDKGILEQIESLTMSTFIGIRNKLMNPIIKCLLKPFMKDTYAMVPEFDRLQQEYIDGKSPIIRNATALLVFHAPQKHLFALEDANLAYQNASLMAQSLGVTQIYMGFIMSAIKYGNENKFNKLLGIENRVYAIMALGMPVFTYPKFTKRNKS